MNRAKANKIFIAFMYGVFQLGVFNGAYALNEKEQWLKENDESLRIKRDNPPVIQDHGGPDDGGYYFIDSDDDATNAPVYEWVDITDGTPLLLGDDDNQGPFDLGFNFEFYDSTFSSINICSNGFLSFKSISTAYLNAPIPNRGEPNNLLAIFWDDLSPNNGGQVYYKQDTDPGGLQRFIVSYDGIPHYQDIGSLFFQVILYETGDIIYQYGSMNDDGHGNDGATIGIEDAGGNIGTQYAYNENRIHDEMAIYFGLNHPIYADHDVSPSVFVRPASRIGEVGIPLDIEVRFMNNGGNMETFDARLSINYNGEVYNETVMVSDLPSGQPIDVTFPSFAPPEEGSYEISAITELAGDEIPSNDTIRIDFAAFADIYIEDFEGDDGLFVGDNDWEWGHPVTGPNGGHSGQNLWATVLAGNYNAGPLLSTLISPSINLSGSAHMTLWHWYDTESGFDGGNLKISVDDGESWQLLTPADGYDGLLSTNFENPIGGEEAFFGMSNEWIQETFDLAAYAGASVTIKFDFGSDSSIDDIGWYVDDVIVYGGGGAEPGWIAGVVTDYNSGDPIEGAIVTAGIHSDETNQNGEYILDLFPSINSVTASEQYHASVTVNGIEVVAGETTMVDFALPAPSIQVDTTPIEISLSPGETAEFTRNMANSGSGDLNFNIALSFGDRRLRVDPDFEIKFNREALERGIEELSSAQTEFAPISNPGNPPTTLDFGDEVFVFDPQTPANDVACLGVEFDGAYFWVTGRDPDSGDDAHKLHKYDRDGNYIESFNQSTISIWGWRDLAWDGTYLYASDENEMAVIDPTTGHKIGEIPMPGGLNPPLRALAYDSETDHFWTANFNSNIVEFNRNGETLGIYSNSFAAYGMAWDDASADGPWLWVFSQDGSPMTQISQFDPRTGQYTGVVFYAIDHNGGDYDVAGGACYTTDWDPTLGILFCLVQGSENNQAIDQVQGYEITPFSQWLMVDPMSGILAPSENIDLSIGLDFTGDDIVPDSIYQAQIIINNNSAETPVIPVTIDVRSGIDDDNSGLPRDFSLHQNYPNPFNPSTSIKFALPEQSDVSIEIFNILGQKVASVFKGLLPAGYHNITWDGSSAASGIYYFKLTAGNFVDVKPMTLLK